MERPEDQGESDARLAIAAGRGDDEAFAILYVRYAPRILAYLTRLLDDEHLAQDLTHEVFVSALRRLRLHRPPIAFGPWLFRIARNASIDVHRRSRLVRQVSLDGPGEEAVAPGNGPEGAAELRQFLDDLRDLLGGLSAPQREALVMRELEGLSNGEIGQRLGLSRPAVEGLLFRARTKVRQEYEELTSGRRCDDVQATLDRIGSGRRLPRRQLDAVARHVRVCTQCRRHAWEAGASGLLDQGNTSNGDRRALLPLPFGLAALRSLAEPPWGKVAAAATALAVAGGTVVPQIPRTEMATVTPLPMPHTPLVVEANARPVPAPPRATITASPTPLRAKASGGIVATTVPAPVEAVPPAPRPASPSAQPTALPAKPGAVPVQPEPAEPAEPAPARQPAPAPPKPAPALPKPVAQAAAAVRETGEKVAPKSPPPGPARDAAGTVGEAVRDVAPRRTPERDPVPAPPVPAEPPVPVRVPDPVPASPAPAPAPETRALPARPPVEAPVVPALPEPELPKPAALPAVPTA